MAVRAPPVRRRKRSSRRVGELLRPGSRASAPPPARSPAEDRRGGCRRLRRPAPAPQRSKPPPPCPVGEQLGRVGDGRAAGPARSSRRRAEGLAARRDDPQQRAVHAAGARPPSRPRRSRARSCRGPACVGRSRGARPPGRGLPASPAGVRSRSPMPTQRRRSRRPGRRRAASSTIHTSCSIAGHRPARGPAASSRPARPDDRDQPVGRRPCPRAVEVVRRARRSG